MQKNAAIPMAMITKIAMGIAALGDLDVDQPWSAGEKTQEEFLRQLDRRWGWRVNGQKVIPSHCSNSPLKNRLIP